MNVAQPPTEQVQHEFDRTHPELSPELEHELRLNGMIDKRGTRLPAFYLEIGIIFTGILLVGFYALIIHPLLK